MPNLGDLLVRQGRSAPLAHALELAINGVTDVPSVQHLQMLGMGADAESFVAGLRVTRAAEAAIRKGAA